MPEIAQTAIILPNVVLEDNVIIEDFCIIGIETPNSKNKITRIGVKTKTIKLHLTFIVKTLLINHMNSYFR